MERTINILNDHVLNTEQIHTVSNNNTIAGSKSPQTCEICGVVIHQPRKCSYCGQHFCDDHQLPEKHNCQGLPKRKLG